MKRSSRRRYGPGWLILVSALVLAALPGAKPVLAQDLPAENDRSASLPGVERSRWAADHAALHSKIDALRQAGNWDEVEALTIKDLARTREVLGESNEATISVLGSLASVYKERENWPAARKTLEEVCAVRERQPGRKDWKVGDARRAVADLDRYAAMTPTQRAQWKEANRLVISRFGNDRRPDHDAAVKNGPGPEQILRELLGEDHADYLSALARIAISYNNKGDYAHAVPVLRKRVDILGKAWGESHPAYADALLSLADAHTKLGDYARAEPLYRQAVASVTKAYDYNDSHCLDYLFKLGSQYLEKGDFTHAEPLLRQLQAVLASIAQRQLFSSARPGAELAEKLSRQVHGTGHPDHARSLIFLADNFMALGDRNRAEPLYRQALEIRKKALGEDHPDYATGLNNLAVLYKAKGDYARAEPLYRQALEIRKKALGEGHPAYALSLNNLAALYGEKGDYARAAPLYRQALEIKKRAFGEAHPSYATGLNNLAALYGEKGDYARAERLYRQALEIRKKALGEAHPTYAVSLNNLAVLYKARGEYARAEPLYRQALEIRRKALRQGHPEDYAKSLRSLGSLYQDMGDDARAEPLLREALEIEKKRLGEGDPEAYAASLNFLANLYWARSDHARAEPLYLQALEIRKKVLGEGHPTYAASLNNLANLYWKKGDHARAEPLSQQALAITKKALGEGHPNYAQSLNNLGALYRDKGDYARAKPLFQQAVEIRKRVLGEGHPKQAESLNNLAYLYMIEGDTARAALLFSESLENGARLLRTTLAGFGERQRLRFLAAQRITLDHLITTTPADGAGIVELYRHVLDWKGASDVLRAEDRLLLDQPELRPNLDQLAEVRARLARFAFVEPTEPQRAAWNTELDRLREQKENLEADLARRSSEFRRRERDRQRGPDELAAALPVEAALVELFVYDHRSPSARGKGPLRREDLRLIAFVTRRGRPLVLVPLGPARPVDDAVLAWRRATVERRAGDRDAAAAELSRRVWEPLRTHLGDARTVWVAPDRQLLAFAFAALPGRKPGSYLIEDLAIGYVASGRQAAAAYADPPGPPGRGLLAAGGIDFQADPGQSAPSNRPAPAPLLVQRAGFAPLPATGPEAGVVRDLYHNAFADEPADFLTGAAATEAELKRRLDGGHLRAVHLATHGFFESPTRIAALRAEVRREGESAPTARAGKGNEESAFDLTPMLRSGVVLAGGGHAPDAGPVPPAANAAMRDDGILTAEEVQGLDLRGCELVVLSACETGLGKLEAGQGALGLQRAFQAAGARAVVASLWKVDDAATAVLMERFYANLWTTKLPALEALRRAQIDVLRDPTLVDARRVQLASRGIGSAEEPLPGGASADRPKPGVARRGDPALWAAFLLGGDGGSAWEDSR